MTLYTSSPAVADTGISGDGPLSLGVQFKVTDTGCTLNGFRWYQSYPLWTGTPTAALYAVGGSSTLTTAISDPAGAPASASSEPAGTDQWGAMFALWSDANTRWLGTKPTTGTPQWIKFIPDQTGAATGYTITPHPSNQTYSPVDWKFQGSNDGSSWTDLDTRSGVTWASNAAQHFTFSNSTTYSQYRLLITANNGASDFVAINFITIDGVSKIWNQWREALLGTPYALTNGTDYRAVVLFPTSRSNSQGSLSSDLVNGPLTVPSNAHATNGNHTFASGASMQNPTGSANSNYMLDVVVEKTSSTTYNGAAALTATSTLTATVAPSTLSAAATLTASSVLTVDAFIGSPTVSGSANLTASSTLTASAAANRAATAPLTATASLTATATSPLQAASAALAATSTLTASASGTVAQAATAALYAASALFVEASASTAATASLTATTTLTVAATAFKPWVEPNDPRTGKPQYRLVVADRDGTRNGELTNATTSPVEDGVGVGASFGFTAPTADPKLALIDPPATQVQVWRGTGIMSGDPTPRPVFRGPVVTASQDVNGSTTFQCRDPWWYLESGRRVIGAVPKRDLLVNGSFAGGESPWTGGFEPDSIPAAQPARSVIDVDFFGTRMKALQISGVDKVVTVTQEVKTEAVFVPNSASYLPGGASAIIAVAQKMPKTGTLQVRVDGYTADNRINGDPGDGMQLSKDRADAAKATILGVRPGAVITTAGHGYYNQIPGGQAANRRVVISWNGVQEASGHKQYEAQTLTVTQPVAAKAYLPLTAVIWVKITKWIGPSKDGRGLYLQIVNPANPAVVVDSGVFNIDEKTPRDRWIRMEASLQNGVPADGIAYQAQVRLYPPAGTALFTRGGLYPGDQLAFFDVDQSLIIKGLVEHAQDTSIGKGALGIGTRCQPTGFTRTREYPYDERMPIETAIKEIAALFEGPEVVMEVTATAQTVVTYHPRQGVATSQVVVHGGNSVAYQAPTDTRDAASSIILQADGSGADREEGYASDAAALDGLMLEQVISTEGETPVTELTEGAQSALASLKHPQPAIWVTVDPRRTGAVLATIGQGDTLRYVNDVAGFDGTFRFVKRRLSFNDVLEMMLTPEG